MLKIYHAKGLRSVRVIWLCEEMGVSYETIPASFMQPSEEFKALNPLRTIPVLVDGDTVMIESIAMLLYVMGKYGPTDLALDPSDPDYGAYLQFLMFGEAALATFCGPLIGTRMLAPDDQKENFTVGLLRKSITRRLKYVGQQLDHTPYLAGGRFTAADISVVYAIDLANVVGLGDAIPSVVKDYRTRIGERPAFQKAMACD